MFGETGWEFELVNGTNSTYDGVFTGHVYPVGIDPVSIPSILLIIYFLSLNIFPKTWSQGWHGADNYLIFTNSYKMKMSVILGVMQVGYCFTQTFVENIEERINKSIILNNIK